MSDGSEHAVRGWKASEMAEQSLVSNRRQDIVLHRVWWSNHMNLPISNIVTVVLLVILLSVIMVRRWNARHPISMEKREKKKMDTVVETNGGKEEECCSCSSRDEGDTAMVAVSLRNAHAVGDGDVISKRVEEATMTLSSIHSRLPDSMSRKDKVAMTHMMLEAIKVNEACKTTASMERMESISERGVEIQSGTYDMKQRQYRKKEVTKRAQYISKMVMDIMFTGVLVMILSGGCTAWYHGILASKTHTCITSDTSFFYGGMVADMIRTVSCYVLHLVRALQAVIILVLTPVCINKMGIHQKVEDLPIFTLGATFSGICGISGTYVVRWLGGRGMLWLIMWQLWVIACVLCLLLSSRISKYYLFSAGTSQVKGDAKTFRQSGILVAMWIVLGVLYPILMGTVALLL